MTSAIASCWRFRYKNRYWVWLGLPAAGQFRLLETASANLMSELERLKPAEIFLSESLENLPASTESSIYKRLPACTDYDNAVRHLTQLMGTHDLSAFGCNEMHAALQAAGGTRICSSYASDRYCISRHFKSNTMRTISAWMQLHGAIWKFQRPWGRIFTDIDVTARYVLNQHG